MNKIKFDEKIREIIDKIVKNYKPEKVVMFGSFASGKQNDDSDIDLLVVKDSKKSRYEREAELRKIFSPSSVAIDFLAYTPFELEKKIKQEKNLFFKDIIKNGITLYANDRIYS